MRRFIAVGLATLSLGGMLLAFNPAPAHADDSPMVTNLQPFSQDCNYMSRAGFLRLMVFNRDGVWLSRTEAVAIVNSQSTAAGE